MSSSMSSPRRRKPDKLGSTTRRHSFRTRDLDSSSLGDRSETSHASFASGSSTSSRGVRRSSFGRTRSLGSISFEQYLRPDARAASAGAVDAAEAVRALERDVQRIINEDLQCTNDLVRSAAWSPYTLHFVNSTLERLFRHYHLHKHPRQTRQGLTLFASLLALFTLLSYLVHTLNPFGTPTHAVFHLPDTVTVAGALAVPALVFLCNVAAPSFVQHVLAFLVLGSAALLYRCCHDTTATGILVLLLATLPTLAHVCFRPYAISCALTLVYFLAVNPLVNELALFNLTQLCLATLIFCLVAYRNEYHSRRTFLFSLTLEHEHSRLRGLLGEAADDDDGPTVHAPIETVRETLSAIIEEDTNLAQSSKDRLDAVFSILADKENIYRPDLRSTLSQARQNLTIDADTRSWLMSELGPRPEINSPSATPLGTDDRPVSPPRLLRSGSRLGLDLSSLHGDQFLHLLPSARRHDVLTLLEEDTYNKDVFKLDKLTEGRPLYFAARYLFHKHGFVDEFDVPETQLHNFVSQIEKGYQDNPYHNKIHAADVLLTTDNLLVRESVAECLTPLDHMAVLVAACVHDYEHPGRNNGFLVKTRDELAMRYNDKSPLENHHVAAACSVLAQPETDIFCNLTREQATRVRQLMIALVLATDMAEHLEYVNKFRNRTQGTFDPANNRKDLLLLLKMCIKCADLSHTSKSYELHINWVDRVTNEFYLQGDAEIELGVPVSPMCDRTKPAPAKSQVGFFEFAILPMFEALSAFVPLDDALEQLDENYAMWLERKDAEEGQEEQVGGGDEQ